MNRIVRLFCVALFLQLFLLPAHSQVLFQEDFDGIPGPTAGGAGTYTFAPGWLLRNADNRTPDAQTAYVNEAWERREDFSFNVADSCAFSTSYYSPVGPSDDWMWTPLINLNAGAGTYRLRWNAVAYDASFRDGYEVRIMVGGAPTGGTGVIGNQVTNSTVIFSTTAEASSWTAHEVDLTAYAGQSVYIAFRNNSNDKFLLLIDDVIVEKRTEWDANLLTHTRPSDYSKIPLVMNPTIPLIARIRNDGASPITNVRLTATVFDASNTQVFTSTTAPVASLAPGAFNDFTASPFTPTTQGDYRIEYTANIAETDQFPANNLQTDGITISTSEYARDTGTITGQLGIGSFPSVPGYLGQHFVITNSTVLNSVSIYLTNVTPPGKMGMAVYDFENGKPTTLLYQAPAISPAAAGAWYLFPVMPGTGLPVSASDTIVVTAVEIDSTLSIGQTNNLFTPGSTWINWPANPFTTWANNEQFGAQFGKPFMIRANFGSPCPVVPTVDPVPNQTVCAGGSITAIAFNVSAGDVAQWTNSAPSIGLPASGSGDIAAFNAVNTTNAPITATITVTPVNNTTSCTGNPQTFTITVNPTTTVTTATPASQTICSGTNITPITFSSSATGATFNWTRDNTSVTGIAASGSGNITGSLINTTTAPITVTFTITPTIGSCAGTPVTATVTVNPAITMTCLPDIVVCGSQAVNYTLPIATNNCGTSTGPIQSITTTLAAGNNHRGNMFNIEAVNTITISSFDAHPMGNTNIAIYYKTGTYAGFETNAAAWTLIGTADVTAQPFGTATPVPVPVNVVIPAGQTYAFYVTSTNTPVSLHYTDGTSEGAVYRSDANLRFFEGIGLEYPFTNGTGNVFRPRIFNGKINYKVGGPTPITPTLISGLPGGSVFPVGTTVNTYQATDGTGNTATCSFNVIVNPVPTVNTVANQTVCNNGATTAINFSGAVAGTTFSWTNNNTSIGLPANGNTDIGSFNAVNTTNNPVTATITVTPSYTNAGNTCTGTPIDFTITVDPTPAVTAIASQTICSGETISTITPTGPVAGSTFTWTRDNTATVTGIAANGNGDISGALTNTTNAPVTVTFTITPTANGCPGTPSTATITVNPIPGAIATPASQTVCSGAITPIVLMGNIAGTTFNWTRDNTATVTGINATGSGDISGTLTNTTTSPVTVTFTITPVANGCHGTPITATVVVGAAPVIVCPANITVSNTTNTCGAAVTYTPTTSGVPAPDLTYSFSGATTGSGNGSGSGSTFNVGTTTVTITATNSCGTTNCSFTVTVNDTQLPAITCPAPVTVSCASAVPPVDIASVTATDNCPGVTITHVGDVIGSQTCANKYTITRTYRATDAAGNSATCAQTITVNDQTAPVVTCPSNMTATTAPNSCTAVVNFNVTATDNCSGTVTVVSTPASGFAFPVGVTTVTSTATDVCGNTSTCTFTVTVADAQVPVISAQPVNDTACVGENARFTVTATNAVSYQWQVNNGSGFTNIPGATLAALNVNNVTLNMHNYQYRVIVQGPCSAVTSNAALLKVNERPAISITASPLTSLLPNQTTTLYAAFNHTPGSFAWYQNNNPYQVTTAPLLPNLTVDNLGSYYVIYTDNNGCSTTSNTIAIQANPDFQFWVYPVPNDGRFTVRLYSNTLAVKRTLRVWNSAGTLVFRKEFTMNSSYERMDVDINKNSAGVYMLDLIDASGKTLGASKVVVVK